MGFKNHVGVCSALFGVVERRMTSGLGIGRLGFRAGVLGSFLYSLARVLLDVLATSHGNQAQLQSEVLALRRQVQVWDSESTSGSH